MKWMAADDWEVDPPELRRLPTPVVNIDCLDVSKQAVAEVFEKAFGVELKIDPRTFVGPAVKKSNLNARHDAEVVICPTDEVLDPGLVYQRHVDTSNDDGLLQELRTVMVARSAVLVYVKYRRPEHWFGVFDNERVHLASPELIYSSAELANLAEFCRLMHLDYCELDVLRDSGSNQIYVIDANPTPFGPLKQLTRAEFAGAATLIGHALAEAFGPVGMAQRIEWPAIPPSE